MNKHRSKSEFAPVSSSSDDVSSNSSSSDGIVDDRRGHFCGGDDSDSYSTSTREGDSGSPSHTVSAGNPIQSAIPRSSAAPKSTGGSQQNRTSNSSEQRIAPRGPSSTPSASADFSQTDEKNRGTRNGKFSKEESRTVVEAVKHYAMTNGVSVERLCGETRHKGDLHGAWTTIALCLPDRTVPSIYRHGIRQLHASKRGLWSDQEVSQLQILVGKHGNKWKMIAQLMDRSSDMCRDKYREQLYVPGNNKAEWSPIEEQLLLKVVEERTGDTGSADEVGQGKADIPWAEVAMMVGTRNRVSCMKKWLYLKDREQAKRLREREPLRRSQDLSLMADILKTGARHDSELVWTKLPYPRAQRRWAHLRKMAPKGLDLHETANAIIKRLRQQAAEEEVILSTPATKKHSHSPPFQTRAPKRSKTSASEATLESRQASPSESGNVRDTDDDRGLPHEDSGLARGENEGSVASAFHEVGLDDSDRKRKKRKEKSKEHRKTKNSNRGADVTEPRRGRNSSLRRPPETKGAQAIAQQPSSNLDGDRSNLDTSELHGSENVATKETVNCAGGSDTADRRSMKLMRMLSRSLTDS